MSQLRDLTANHSTARDLLHLGVVTAAMPGRSLVGPVGQPSGLPASSSLLTQLAFTQTSLDFLIDTVQIEIRHWLYNLYY